MHKILIAIILSVLLSPVLSAYGQNQPLYERAYAHFEHGDYQQALAGFESLLASDPDNPALFYNIGLCYHFLKDYSQADYYFTELLEYPDYEFWAIYQLALNDWEQGFYGAAEIGLMEVVYQSNDADLVELATARYAELLSTLPQPTDTESTWQGGLALGRGMDDNIVDPRFLDASDQKDGFTDFSASLARQGYNHSGGPNWQWQAVVFVNRFDDIDGADLTVFATDIVKYLYSDNWQYRVGVEYEHSQSGGEDYLAQLALNLEARSNGGLYRRGWLLDYQYADIKSLSSDFDQLAGDSQHVQIEYRLPLSNAVSWRIGFDWLKDNRKPITGTILLSDLSARRQSLETGILIWLNNWRLELGYDQRDSHYDQILRSDMRVIDRDDDRRRLLARADYNFNDHWSFYLEANDIDNQSDIPRFDYQQRTLISGISWYF
jgi:tetratricopeptide (TPR) repeat protein